MSCGKEVIKESFSEKTIPEKTGTNGSIVKPSCPSPFDASLDCDPVTLYLADGSLYKTVPSGGSETLPSFEDVDINAEQRSGPDVDVDEVAAGGSFQIEMIDVLDKDDNVVESIEYGETIKIMKDYSSIAVVGDQVQVTPFDAPTLKPCPIHVQPPSPGASSFYSGDFIDQYTSGLFDFYNYGTDPVTMKKLGADSYTLNAMTPNPWSGTDRFTDVDGNGPISSQIRWVSYPSGWDYIALDHLHDLMWYQPNLGNCDWEGALDAAAALNSASFKGFTDWFIPPFEFFLMSAYPNPAHIYYDVENLCMRNIISGYSDTKVWTSRRAELSTGNAMSFFSAYDWRRSGYTSTSLLSTYACRFIQPTDSYLP